MPPRMQVQRALQGWAGALALACVLLAATAPALAQQTALAVSPAVACLTPTAAERGKPVYPPDLLERKDGDTLEVELVFTDPKQAPEMKRLNKDLGFTGLWEAVETHVARFRVPCMVAAAGPVTLRQTYVFIPNDGRKVMASALTDSGDVARRTAASCVKHKDGKERPIYPWLSLRKEEQGQVFVLLQFTAADAPPELQVLAAAPHNRLLRAVVDFAEGLRMPCLEAGPVSVTNLHIFKIEGGARSLLSDTSFVTLIRSARDLPLPVYFDLNTMGCPFDVRLTYYRPHQLNVVGELENSNPARRPLLDWLAQIQLDLPPATNTSVLGQDMTVSVPCGTVDL